MSIEANKSLLLRYYEAANQGNLAVMDETISPDFMVYLPGFPQPIRGPEGVKRAIMMNRNSFPDLFVTVNDLIAEGDKVVVVWTSRGTNTGPLMGMPPTNRQMMFIGVDIWRIAGGKIVENFSIEQPFEVPPPGSYGNVQRPWAILIEPSSPQMARSPEKLRCLFNVVGACVSRLLDYRECIGPAEEQIGNNVVEIWL